ncbi:MAG: sigma-54 dependent transcriptional regulator [Planctomycetes bacterium]|nr:sigma-54 dependent transcriptional regulator [Planctomycetota bacterium]
MKKLKVHFVEDDATLRTVLARELGELGFEVTASARAEGVLDAARAAPPDAFLIDLKLPGKSGLELLRELLAADPHTQVVMLTGHGAVPEAVQAMRLGAHDFLTKPARLDVLEQVLRRAAEKRGLALENRRLRRVLDGQGGAPELVGSSPPMQELRRVIERVAKSDVSLVVQGESGTGKEVVARNVHALGARAAAPFVVVNCGAIPASLFESELFGHERGAFTGAEQRRMGLFEAADGGTLFLDEIGELPRTVQPALLRALQFGEVRSVGAESVRRVDVRVIAATNRDLRELVRNGEFREDLYYRIAALDVTVPPLRARRADIRALAVNYLARSGHVVAIDEAAFDALERYDWPGNVRELENTLERLCLLVDDARIDGETVSKQLARNEEASGPLPTLDLHVLERIAVVEALAAFKGDKREAAKALGVSLKTLYNQIDRHGLRKKPVTDTPPPA